MAIKKIICAAFFLILFFIAGAQQPVNWHYSAKKITEKTYEVSITAYIQEGWHIYAQRQPEDAIASPTKIKFTKNPLFIFSGGIKEVGKMEKHKDPVLGTEAYRYARQVNFVQVVKLKTKARSGVAGSVTFQACTDEKCLFPETINFDIPISE